MNIQHQYRDTSCELAPAGGAVDTVDSIDSSMVSPASRRRRFTRGPLLMPASAPTPSPSHPDAGSLLRGFSLFIHFLLKAESDFLCGVPSRSRSPRRRNYRMGYRERKLHISLGTIPILCPMIVSPIMYAHVPIVKRARRVSPDIFAQLSRILNGGRPVDPADSATFIKILWTLELSDSLLATLVERLTPVLEQWRRETVAHTLSVARQFPAPASLHTAYKDAVEAGNQDISKLTAGNPDDAPALWQPN